MTITDAMLDKLDWRALLEKLKNKEIPPSQIGSLIAKLGKPFDVEKILISKEVVAAYLSHQDPWVRHEAMWFLTSWGRLPEYQPALIQALRHDPDADNRSYAASCLGVLQKGTKNPEAMAALKVALLDAEEDELVRKYAYRSLLQVLRNSSDVDFSPNDKRLSDIDWDWVRSLPISTN